MAQKQLEDPSNVPMSSLADIAHKMKGLVGIFDMIGSTLPPRTDARDIFEQGLDRMRELNAQIDRCVMMDNESPAASDSSD